MNPITAMAFAEELSKSAAIPGLMRSMWRSGIARGVGGAVIGGATGYGLGGGDTGDPELDKAHRRAGALKGALLGAAGGLAAPLVTAGGRQRAREGLKKFVARERHGVLGGKSPEILERGLQGPELLEHRRAVHQGLTSIPGIAKSMVSRPGETLRNAWQQAGTLGKVMAVGDLAMGARDVFDPNAPGGKAEKAGRLLGSSGGYLLGGKLPFLSSMLFSGATGAAGKYLGRAVDKITGSGQQPVAAPPQAVP